MSRRPGHMFYDYLTMALIVAAAFALFVLEDKIVTGFLTVFAVVCATRATRGDGR